MTRAAREGDTERVRANVRVLPAFAGKGDALLDRCPPFRIGLSPDQVARILVIDDSPTVGLAVRNALAQDGHIVERAASFIDLPRALGDNRPDLVLLDLEMPGFSGVSVGVFLAEKYGAEGVPVLIHSDKPHDELAAAARAVGALGFIRKAKSDEKLREAVAQVLRARAGGA